MSELDELVTGVRRTVADADWPDPAQIRARGERRTAQTRLAVAAMVAVILIGVATAVTAAGNGRRPPPPAGTAIPSPAATSPAATSPTAGPHPGTVPRVTDRLTLVTGNEPAAVALGAGDLWLAGAARPIPAAGNTPGAGRLFRFDGRTAARKGEWPIAGSPTALVVTAHHVWVASGVGDGHPPARDANLVQQFSLDGALLHSYPFADPFGLVAVGDDVWVEYGSPGEKAYLSRLHDGVAAAPVRLTGANPGSPNAGGGWPLIACPDGYLYAATVDGTGQTLSIDRVATSATGSGSITGTFDLPQLGLTVLGCRGHGGAVAVINQPTGSELWQLTYQRSEGKVPKMFLPPFAHALGIADGIVWLGVGQGGGGAATTTVWMADADTFAEGDRLVEERDIVFATARDGALWTVAPDYAQPGKWIIQTFTPA